ncbi:MAG: hypothetical protein AAF483_13095, partial [Planctomycetota bacterium]
MTVELRTLLFCSSCLLSFLAPPFQLFAQSGYVYSVDEFYRLENEAARDGANVRLEGTILYSDPDWGLLWLQDETGRILLPVSPGQAVPPARTTALVIGTTKLVDGAPKIVDFQIRKTGKAELPPPKMLTPGIILGRQQEDSRIIGAGIVIQDEMKDATHLRLFIAFLRNYRFLVTVNNCTPKDVEGLLGSHIEVSGCATRFSNVDRPELAAMQMFIPDMS